MEGKTSLSTYGMHPQPTGNPHTAAGPKAFATPMHNYGAGSNGMTATHEMRNGDVPHINMHPANK